MPRSHLALFQKYLPGITRRSGQPWSGVSGSSSPWVASSAFSSRRYESGTFAVKSCSECAIAKAADGRRRASLSSSLSTSPKTRNVHVARSVRGTEPACSTGHFSVRYWPGGRRAGSYPSSCTLRSAFDLNTLSSLGRVQSVTTRAARRSRAFVRVKGPDAAEFLQRMVSNDVVAGEACEALLLTAKARVIAPLVVWRRGEDDFLLLTEPELGETVRAHLTRMRFAAKCEIEREEHSSTIVFDDVDGIPTRDYGVPAVEVLDAEVEPTVDDGELERLRVEAGTPRWGREIDDRVLPAEAGLEERAISFDKGCYPGQEPIARLRYRGHVNRRLRVLDVYTAEPGDEIIHGEKTVGRITSAVGGVALGYVRIEVPDDAELIAGGKPARLRP